MFLLHLLLLLLSSLALFLYLDKKGDEGGKKGIETVFRAQHK